MNKTQRRPPPRKGRQFIRITPDTIALVGLILIIHEAILYKGEQRPFLIGLFGTMVGLAGMVRIDDLRNRIIREDDEEEWVDERGQP